MGEVVPFKPRTPPDLRNCVADVEITIEDEEPQPVTRGAPLAFTSPEAERRFREEQEEERRWSRSDADDPD